MEIREAVGPRRVRTLALAGIGVFLGLWCLLSYGGLVPRVILPSPTDVLWAFPRLHFEEALVRSAFWSLYRVTMAFILSALTVHFRDVRDLLSNLLTLWFWATPIVYPWTLDSLAAQPAFQWLVRLNPFAQLAIAYQDLLFFRGSFSHLPWLVLTGGVSLVVLLGGYWLFDRLRDSFEEAV